MRSANGLGRFLCLAPGLATAEPALSIRDGLGAGSIDWPHEAGYYQWCGTAGLNDLFRSDGHTLTFAYMPSRRAFLSNVATG